MPKFTDTTSWQQAELLMQPAFIRIIDHIRKHLDQSTWKGTYQEFQIWPEGTSDETKATVTNLRQQLEAATPEMAPEIEQEIARLPSPHPGYILCLQQQDRQVKVDLWELCYQVCFRNYIPALGEAENQAVEIDTSLIDETGDVDWQPLDSKAKHLVERVFASLPVA